MSIQSDNSEKTITVADLLSEALDLLDHTRNLDDLYTSMRIQGELLKFIIWILENLRDETNPP